MRCCADSLSRMTKPNGDKKIPEKPLGSGQWMSQPDSSRRLPQTWSIGGDNLVKNKFFKKKLLRPASSTPIFRQKPAYFARCLSHPHM